ncbi:alpha/beta hydrolase family protein [Paenibacillus agricola]|uniref:Prolyl oligopeptidase family serine peptidase n=1 Tax=Paenibacillus agricola TaxID=2716264 RepID=A0ABX0JHR9_9BACL|nr:prolyl oligopeptidase family serine peptidase [Paenibacillus agricola]NHN34243.1 prolyl oligopeptidase family serine peptidase [Paenibacillus agricola]
MFDLYEDAERLTKNTPFEEFISPYQDLRYYASSVTPGLRLAANIIKPEQPASILIQLHGWHMSMPKPEKREVPLPGAPYLVVQIDMRGRAFSEGNADCNGLELIDIYDAVQFVRSQYAGLIADPAIIHLEGGSGGGGNVLAAVNKFPDFFASAVGLYGISDYAEWYKQDQKGEFRDDMDIWIGYPPEANEEGFKARSGLYLLDNLQVPLYIAHGDGDIRVPVQHSRQFIEKAEQRNKTHLLRYTELTGVGGWGHLDHITDDQRNLIRQEGERQRLEHSVPISIPEAGRLWVGGYLYTKPFQVHLESIDQLAILDYDQETGIMNLTARKPYAYRIQKADGTVVEGKCSVVEDLVI